MESGLSALGAVVAIAVIRPLFWFVSLGLSLWIGRKFLSPKWGKRIFGHYWKDKSPLSAGTPSGNAPLANQGATALETAGSASNPLVK